MTTLCATLSLSFCTPLIQTEPLFSDIQRAPPRVAPETVDHLIREERPLAAWIAETNRNCETFGCAE